MSEEAKEVATISVVVVEQGCIFGIPLAPTMNFNVLIPEEAMNSICAQWIESRRAIRHQLDIVRPPSRGKIVS